METSWLVSMGPTIAAIIVFLAFVTAGAGLYMLSTARFEDVRRRLNQIQAGPGAGAHSGEGEREGVFLVRWLEPAGELILPQAEWRRSLLERELVIAGFRQPRAIYIYLGTKLVMAMGLPLLLTLAAMLTGKLYLLAQFTGLLFLVVLAVAGFLVPDLALRYITNRRHLDYIEGFPDALDMLVVCVEAGLGLDAAIDRVAREIRVSHPSLAIELGLISLEIRAGKSREEALRSMSERMDVDQIQSLATLLIQAEKFGTSIATALRTFAEEMRVERIQRARETAAKLPVRLVFPIVFCIFPALLLVVLGPAVTRIFSILLGSH